MQIFLALIPKTIFNESSNEKNVTLFLIIAIINISPFFAFAGENVKTLFEFNPTSIMMSPDIEIKMRRI